MAVLDLVENIRISIEARDVYLAFFIDFFVSFNCIHPSYIFSCFLGGGLTKHSALVIADSFSGRVFAVVRADGSLAEWYPFDRGFGQGLRGRRLYYNSSSPSVPSLIHPSCMYHMFADDKIVERRCSVCNLRIGVADLQASVEAVQVWWDQ